MPIAGELSSLLWGAHAQKKGASSTGRATMC